MVCFALERGRTRTEEREESAGGEKRKEKEAGGMKRKGEQLKDGVVGVEALKQVVEEIGGHGGRATEEKEG